MKKNTFNAGENPWKDLPNEVVFLKFAMQCGQIIGYSTYMEIIKKYPEHFPEEIGHVNRWAAVPEETKAAFFKELNDFRKELWKDAAPNPGVIGHIEKTAEAAKWNQDWVRLYPLEVLKEKELHDKYFKQYGIWQ